MRKYLISFVFMAISASATWAQNAPVLMGGIGEESSAEIRAKQGEFNLRFVFTLMEGDFVADVAVKIVDGAGKVVLQETSIAPIFLTKLPAGKYEATLTYEGVAQTRKFALGVKGQRMEQVRWKRSSADGEPML